MSDCGLYQYQEEVVQRALQGENVIIWLPTGGGKTRAAVYVAKRHLETTPGAKVVVLVNKVHLVDQHYSNEFKPHLGQEYDLVAVSGECESKDFFGKVVQDSHVVICTAQILENSLVTADEDKHVELSDITLLIIDECHHTNKQNVYNKIMRRYVEKKLKGETRLPQILGLTASPGTGGQKTLKNAVEHVLQICANLDSSIVSCKTYASELKKMVPRPTKRFNIVNKRPEDPFEGHLKWMMKQIHDIMVLPPNFTLSEIGTEKYEADVVLLEQSGVTEGNRLLAQCALHLRRYNDALLINDTLRMLDAYRSLKEFYRTKEETAIDGTDWILLGLFQENQVELRKLAKDDRFENPKMGELLSTLLEQFGPREKSRCILFCKTRRSTHCLHDWVLNNRDLQEAGIKAAILTGAGNGISYMTQTGQKDTIRNFRDGVLNLLISTNVAEEGLDIPECNLVVRYGLMTNEVAQQQASGRARARDSIYSVVAEAGGREVRREHTNDYLEELTSQAISEVQGMAPREFRIRITDFQTSAIIAGRLAENLKITARRRYRASDVQLLCRNCFEPVACGDDIRLVDGVHYVNVNPNFEMYYKIGGQVEIDTDLWDWEPGRVIICSHGNCNKEWGFEMKYKKLALLPMLAIKNFALQTPDGRTTVKKWKDVQFPVDDFSLTDYSKDKHPDLFEFD